jgi:hypothetical protein
VNRPLLAALVVGASLLGGASTSSASIEPTSAHAVPEWTHVSTDDGALGDAARDAIQHDAFAYARSASVDDTRAVLAALSGPNATCNRAHAAAVAGVLAAGVDPQVVAATVLSASTSCNEVIDEAAGFVPNPDRALAAALLQRDTRAAWLSYGSIAETARRRGDHELARSIDVTLARRMLVTNGEEHLLAVRAAGNAGCEACAPMLAADAASSDVGLRRAAVTAQRFLGNRDSVQRMCSALEHDEDQATRDLAAWALEWRSNDANDRAECLERAARSDRSKGVRLQAVRALGILADEDTSAAHEALARLATGKGEVGRIAVATLDVHASASNSAADMANGEFSSR